MKDENYVPYGEEWKDELMKYPKIFIIGLLRQACLERDEAIDMVEIK